MSVLFLAKNKKEAAKDFMRLLGIKYSRGPHLKEHDYVVFWVEIYVLAGMTKEKAIEKAANELGEKFEATSKRYYEHRSEEVKWYAEDCYNEDCSWQDGPKIGSRENPGYLILWRALMSQSK